MTTRAGRRGLLAAEQQVLLLLAADRTSDDRLIALLRSDIDWDALLSLAQHERAGAELYRRVRHLLGVDVPPATMTALHRMSMVSDFEMLHLEQCLRETLAVLESLGMRVMLLKGSALVHSVYGGVFTSRPMVDIDLLVDEARAMEAHQKLVAGRWKKMAVRVGDEVYHAYHHHLPPLRDARGSGVHLELHTALFARGHPFTLTPDRLWRSAEPLSATTTPGAVPPRDIYLPSLTHQLLHTCLHFAWSHAMKFGAWRTFRDVAGIIATGRFDWDDFVRTARETRALTACYWTFRLAAAAADIRVPREVQQAMRPPRPGTYLSGLERHYLLNLLPATQTCPSVLLDRTLWNMGMLPSWSGHGAARPWDEDSHFVPASDPGQPVPQPNRMRQFWRATQYLRAVLGFGRWEGSRG